MLSDRFWERGMKYIAEMFQYHAPEYQQVAWRASLDDKKISDEAFGKAVKFIGGSLKQWNQTTNLAALVLEYVDDIYKIELRGKAIESQNPAWPKQLPAATPETKTIVAFHEFAYARFKSLADAECPRPADEGVANYTRRMQGKILSECRVNGKAIPQQYAEAWI